MTEDNNKPKKPWTKRSKVIAWVSAIATVIGVVIAFATFVWTVMHPNQSTATAPVIVKIGTFVYQAIASQPEISTPKPVPVPTPVMASPPALSWTPLHRLSTTGDITFEVGDKIKIDPSNANLIHVPFRIASQAAAHKIFALNAFPLAGWSLTTVNGTNCHIDTDLHGLHVYTRNQLNDYVNEIQVALPGAPVTGNIFANCEKHINNNDMFYLATQLYLLPEDATPGNANPSVINFNSEPIPAN